VAAGVAAAVALPAAASSAAAATLADKRQVERSEAAT
jgi:hypothetical protein